MPECIIVENSTAPGAIGDTIAAFPALSAYAWRLGTPLGVYLACRPARKLLPAHPYLHQLDERPEHARVLDVQSFAPHHMQSGYSMSQAYLEAIGLPDVAQIKIPEVSIDIGEQPEQMPQYDVLLAPFSHSDNGTNTKIWPREKWASLVNGLRQNNHSIGLLGTEKDIQDWGFWHDLPVQFVFDHPLPMVGWFLKNCKIAMTTDNGLNWMAQALHIRHILLLPPTTHPHWSGNIRDKGLNFPIAIDTAPILHILTGILANGN